MLQGNGHLICSALPVPPGASVTLSHYPADHVVDSTGFAIGMPIVGAISKRWITPLEMPIRGDDGIMIGSVSAPLDLVKFNPFVDGSAFDGLPAGTTANLFAPDMTLLARSVDPDKWIGSRRDSVPVLKDLIARRSGTIVDANAAACRFYGHALERLQSMRIDDIELCHWNEEETLRRRLADGSLRDVEMHSGSIVVAGRPLVCAIILDVTERKRLEEAVALDARLLEEQAGQLARKNVELEQFAYVASHDLRQPLRMISSYLNLIERRMGPQANGDLREFLDFAIGGAKNLDRLILDLLDYSRVGRDGNALAEVSLATAVEDSLRNLQVAIDEGDAEIAVQPDLPSVHGNAVELTRLFQNLIGNAIKYRAIGRRLEVAVGAREDADAWLVWVRDNGVGIAPEDHERVFAVFQRLVTSDQVEGTGIGLAICQKIVEHHGGRIWIESEPDRGTTFYFTLPRGTG